MALRSKRRRPRRRPFRSCFSLAVIRSNLDSWLAWPNPEATSQAPMSSDRVIIDAIKMAQRLLSQNLAPTHNLPDATTVMRFRDLVRSPAIQSALERSSDTFAAFALRAVERALADRSRTDREIISRLWDLLDGECGENDNNSDCRARGCLT